MNLGDILDIVVGLFQLIGQLAPPNHKQQEQTVKAFLQLSLPLPQTEEEAKTKQRRFSEFCYSRVGPVLPDGTELQPISESVELTCTVDASVVNTYADDAVLTVYCDLNDYLLPTQEQYDGWVTELRKHGWFAIEEMIPPKTESVACNCEACQLQRRLDAEAAKIVDTIGTHIAVQLAKIRKRGTDDESRKN